MQNYQDFLFELQNKQSSSLKGGKEGCGEESWKLKHQEKSPGVMFPARPRTRQSPTLALHPPSLVVPPVYAGFLAGSLSSSLSSPWRAPGGVCTKWLPSILLSHCLSFSLCIMPRDPSCTLSPAKPFYKFHLYNGVH